MKVFICYASAGAGHQKAAEAIRAYLVLNRPDVETVIFDIQKKGNILFRFSFGFFYVFLVKHQIFLWKLLYWITSRPRLNGLMRFVTARLSFMNALDFVLELKKSDPDYVLSTHFTSTQIAADLKRSGQIKSKLISVVTDYGAHPIWMYDGVDRYIVASDSTREELIAYGAEKRIISSFGIPVDSKFLFSLDKQALLEKLNFKKDIFTVLIVTGSFGIGPLEELARELSPHMQVIVVCARNQKLFDSLTRASYANCRVFGFVDNIHELMAAADCIITKPGGMSIAESLCMGLVPVFIAAIPGQETQNIEVLKKLGVGFNPETVMDIKDLLLEFKNNPEKLRELRKKVLAIKKPQATKDICDVIR